MSFPRYPKYKQSGVEWLGEVPAHWEIAKLKHAAAFFSGGTPNKEVPEYWNGDVPWASAKDLKADCIADTIDHITARAVQDGAQMIGAQDIMVVVRGMILAHTFPVTVAGVPMAINQDLKGVRPNASWSKTYFAHLLRASAPETFRRLDEAGHGTKALRMDAWLGMEIPKPPISEQNIIASFLARELIKIDALIAEQERLIELLKEKRQAVISRAVTKGLNPDVPMKDSGLAWLGTVPSHWTMKRLKHISPFITVGIVVNPSDYVVDEGVPFIYGGDIREGEINWRESRRITPDASSENAKTKLSTGDLLTVRVGAPGVTAVVPAECDGGNCASVMLMRQGDFDSTWLCHVMNARIMRFQVEGVQYGAAQEQFNISHAVNFWVPAPPRKEQEEIAVHLASTTGMLDKLVAEAEASTTLLRERRTALITAAVTGQIDVRSTMKAVA